MRSVFDVAANLDTLASCSTASQAAALKRMFRITSGTARCSLSGELAAKYKMAQHNEQTVVSVTNVHTLEQVWWNQARTTKPQTFTAAAGATSAASLDATGNGARCDFCAWPTLTAADPGFGRIQLPHAVSGSNLFKYAEPGHGVVLFKHHDPLAFSQPALSDLLDASWLWMQETSARLQPDAEAHPFFLWNALPRAGASQYHGHAQVMLSAAPVPKVTQLQRAVQSYAQQHAGCCYFEDMLAAHAAVGLVRQFSLAAATPGPASSSSSGGGPGLRPHHQHTAWGFASLAPIKDMEIQVYGAHMCCPAFQRVLHAALRALIDGLGCATFNVGLLNLDLAVPPPAGVGLARQHWRSVAGPAGGGGGDGTVGTSSSQADGSVRLWARGPVVARVVSRGKLSSAASDFGGLEVFGGASIGHTDPFAVLAALEAQLAGGVGRPETQASSSSVVSAGN